VLSTYLALGYANDNSAMLEDKLFITAIGTTKKKVHNVENECTIANQTMKRKKTILLNTPSVPNYLSL